MAAGWIVEDEAYSGCPLVRGETKEPRSVQPPGRAYIYRIHGSNLHRRRDGTRGRRGAVLIRALEPAVGIDLMQERRGRTTAALTSGPGN